MLWLIQTDTGQLCGTAGQSIQRNLHPRENHAAQVTVFRLHHLDGGSGTHINQNQRGFVFSQRGYGDDNTVAAYLGRYIHMDIQTGFQAGTYHHRLLANDLNDTGADGIEYRRHHRRNNTIRNVRNFSAQRFDHIFDLNTVLIRGTGAIRGNAGLKNDLIILHSADENVGIADIDG